MGHIIEKQYGREALDVLSEWINRKNMQRGREVAELSGRNDPEYLFCLFSEDAHEFDVIRKDKKSLEVKVTKCVHADVFKGLNASHIGYKLICAGDAAFTKGFNSKIKFSRPKVLMRGDECCHFIWEVNE